MINCFSKYAFAVPLKTKSSNDIVKALSPILRINIMKHFQTDKGKEWYNAPVKSLLNRYKINHYSTHSEKKAYIIERFNGYSYIEWKWFTANGKYTWTDILSDLVYKYNNTVHRTINIQPADMNKHNENEILLRINKSRFASNKRPSKYKIGDRVRISKYKNVFAKGYLLNWSNEIFTIHSIKQTAPRTYVLKDYKGNVLQGSFYEQEISKTKYGDVYLVEKILKTKGEKVLVHWLGFDKSYHSWINKNNII